MRLPSLAHPGLTHHARFNASRKRWRKAVLQNLFNNPISASMFLSYRMTPFFGRPEPSPHMPDLAESLFPMLPPPRNRTAFTAQTVSSLKLLPPVAAVQWFKV